jgi:hypothetical protein
MDVDFNPIDAIVFHYANLEASRRRVDAALWPRLALQRKAAENVRNAIEADRATHNHMHALNEAHSESLAAESRRWAGVEATARIDYESILAKMITVAFI